MRKYFIALLLTCFFAAPALAAGGALGLTISTPSVQIGKTFTVSVKASSNGVVANTVGADIVYPADLLDVVSVSRPSVITLPITNGFVSAGLVSFQGGIIPSKVLASSPIGTIMFKTKGTGTATISIASTSGIYADDGNGTNLLAGRGTVKITITTAAPPPPTPPVVTPPAVNKPVIPPPAVIPPEVNAPVNQPPFVAPPANLPLNMPGGAGSAANLETSTKHIISQQTLVNIAVGAATVAIIMIIYFCIGYLKDAKGKRRK